MNRIAFAFSGCRRFAALLVFCSVGASLFAAVPPPEKLLPDTTLLMVTAPDVAKLRDLAKKSPPGQFWNDPAMKPFKDNFIAKWNEQFVSPLEKELNIKFGDYTALAQGQATLAVLEGSGSSGDDSQAAVVLIVDTRDKSNQLKKNLADVHKKWVDSGRKVRTEKVRGFEFSVLTVSDTDMPKTLEKFFPKPAQARSQDADSDDAKKPAPKSNIVIGQAESLLILSTSLPGVEKVVAHLGGGSSPALADQAAYQGNHLAMFRDAPLYGWLNAKAGMDILTRKSAEAGDGSDAANPLGASALDKIVGALGLKGLKTVAFNFQSANDGAQFQLFFGVPESSRQGLFNFLVGEPKEVSPPPFVPAEVVKFQRWRLDGQKAWAALVKMLTDFSPQAVGFLDYALDTANANAKEKDPGFDIRKNVIGNLGDDMIGYEKAPRADKLNDAPSLFLLGSPNAEQLASGLKNVLILTSQQAGAPTEREFLGRKIYSVPVPAIPMGMGGASTSTGRNLQYAASGSYVAFSTDSAILEEYLRSSDTQRKALRETPGLTDASQKVTGPGTGLFGYDNRAETMRVVFESLKKNAGASVAAAQNNLNALTSAAGLKLPTEDLKNWMDFSLLPSFDRVSKSFYFSVYGGSANVDGLSFKMFVPTPPQLRK